MTSTSTTATYRSEDADKLLGSNFTVYGTHGFDNDYSYHVRLLLSEVLSRKARERNRGEGSFGQVNVDGSGKATVPHKIECINARQVLVMISDRHRTT
jgi:hypothetical protein